MLNDWSELTLFIYITARITGCVAFNPILGRQGISAMVRSGMVLVLSIFVFSGADRAVPIPVGMLELAIRILLEMGLGFFLGMVMNFFFYIPQLAGQAIDTQMGLTMNQIYDAASQSNVSVTGTMLNVLMTLLFFAANGHHTLLRILLTSGEIVSFGAVSLGPEVSEAMLVLFSECTLLAVKLAMPILAAELLGQLGMGILMKVIPQINVFVINIDVKIIIGYVMLLFLLSPISEFLLMAEMQMLDSMKGVLSLAG